MECVCVLNHIIFGCIENNLTGYFLTKPNAQFERIADIFLPAPFKNYFNYRIKKKNKKWYR